MTQKWYKARIDLREDKAIVVLFDADFEVPGAWKVMDISEFPMSKSDGPADCARKAAERMKREYIRPENVEWEDAPSGFDFGSVKKFSSAVRKVAGAMGAGS